MAKGIYKGRSVKINKPMRGDVKKFKVFVKDRKLDKIELLDMQGRMIRDVAVDELKNDVTSIKLDGLANGIYFVRAIAGGEAVVVKFAKVEN